MSISYDRVLEISGQLGDATVSKYVEEGVVCPPVLRKGLFIIAVMANIGHNPSGTTATTSFHGTSISVFDVFFDVYSPSSLKADTRFKRTRGETQGDRKEYLSLKPANISEAQ